LAAKLTSVRPFDKVLTPLAAIAGIVAMAATAAPPQIKPRLESAATYFSPDLFFNSYQYFTINCEIKSSLSWAEMVNGISFSYPSDYELGTS
jgi:hypothetical protein